MEATNWEDHKRDEDDIDWAIFEPDRFARANGPLKLEQYRMNKEELTEYA